jgi:hypothetical protein
MSARTRAQTREVYPINHLLPDTADDQIEDYIHLEHHGWYVPAGKSAVTVQIAWMNSKYGDLLCVRVIAVQGG